MSVKLIRDTALYLAAVLVLGTVANLIPGRPHVAWWGRGAQPPAEGKDFQFIDPLQAETLRTALPGTVFIDTRALDARSRVPGSITVLYTDLAGTLDDGTFERLRSADAVILYGASEETDLEQLLAQELRLRGLPPPYVMLGGIAAWEASALPLDVGGEEGGQE